MSATMDGQLRKFFNLNFLKWPKMLNIYGRGQCKVILGQIEIVENIIEIFETYP